MPGICSGTEAEERGREQDEESDEVAHLTVHQGMKLWGVTALLRAGAMDEEPLIFKIAKDQLGRLRREGWTRAQQASALFVMVQDRHCKEYLDRFPWLLADLGLELDPACQPQFLCYSG